VQLGTKVVNSASWTVLIADATVISPSFCHESGYEYKVSGDNAMRMMAGHRIGQRVDYNSLHRGSPSHFLIHIAINPLKQ
jgi:hypothetical protein